MEIYEKKFDYEDMKVAMVVQEFYDKHENEMLEYEADAPYYYEDYEDFIWLCRKIRQEWEDLDPKDCSEEEYNYIQLFAERYLREKFLGGK